MRELPDADFQYLRELGRLLLPGIFWSGRPPVVNEHGGPSLFFFWRQAKGTTIAIIRVWKPIGDIWTRCELPFGDRGSTRCVDLGGEWAGPIPCPEEPAEESPQKL